MRARVPAADAALIAAQIEAAPDIDRLRALGGSFAEATPELIAAILEEAVRFADGTLAPFNDAGDVIGCTLVDGRVKTAPGHREAWDAFVASGWPSIDLPVEHGGQGLPLILAAAAQEIFDRACPAFGMMTVPQRSAARLIGAYGDEAMKAEWLPRLASGGWGATICISEPEAGSDVNRIRTLATVSGDGSWSISGEKCWISFGDHDLAPRIGHCLLARTKGAEGLSLFLVPDTLEDGNRNGIDIRRIEHKLGLHASPTCVMGFENAQGRMIGVEGRGLQQMFVMIANMRLAVGAMGLGIASGAADTALAYAQDRKQGGPAGASLAISDHADVQRELMECVAQVEVLRGLLYATAIQADLGRHGGDEDAAALAQWLLPILKTLGGDTAFDVASGAIQILGGAGYTREWPVEQGLRDARVLTIFEGTSGIQALDLVHRRLLRGDRRGFTRFLTLARESSSDALEPCFALLEDAAAKLAQMDARDVDAGARALLTLATLAATGWIAARLSALEGHDPATRRLAAAGRYWLTRLEPRARAAHAEAVAGAAAIDLFEAVRPAA